MYVLDISYNIYIVTITIYVMFVWRRCIHKVNSFRNYYITPKKVKLLPIMSPMWCNSWEYISTNIQSSKYYQINYKQINCHTTFHLKPAPIPLTPPPLPPQEDENVQALVQQYGPKRWTQISKQLRGRTGKQCRERFNYYFYLDCVI